MRGPASSQQARPRLQAATQRPSLLQTWLAERETCARAERKADMIRALLLRPAPCSSNSPWSYNCRRPGSCIRDTNPVQPLHLGDHVLTVREVSDIGMCTTHSLPATGIAQTLLHRQIWRVCRLHCRAVNECTRTALAKNPHLPLQHLRPQNVSAITIQASRRGVLRGVLGG